MEITERKPKVSVCVVTYNQEKYIRQCLQSIIDQETDFDFEVIVGEDCSTDGTRAIVQEFVEKYPGVVKPIFHTTNVGPSKNFILVHQQAIGEYIAHVDGDDECLPGKLNAQVTVLDSDPNCNIVWHRMLVETVDGVRSEGSFQIISNISNMRFDRGTIIQYISIGCNSSKMYRKTVRDFTEPNFDVVDYFANVEQVGRGTARFAGYQPYGVYRLGIGVASNSIKTRQILAKCFEYFFKKYPEYHLQVNTAALTYFVMDLKNFRKTWPMFFMVWIKTFHIGSIHNLLCSLGFMKEMKLINKTFLFDNIAKDLSAFTKNGSFLKKVKCILISHAFHLLLLYRLGVFLTQLQVIGRPLKIFLEYLIRVVYASDISLTSQIGSGLTIMHGHDIVIGGEVKIGKYCKIFNGVTLGNKDTESLINQQPTVGENVVIGTGAKLLGSIQIGDNVVIGANSVVLKSFPSNVIVAGIPAKIVKYSDPNL